jgi:site-specific DNA-cytosine methylase
MPNLADIMDKSLPRALSHTFTDRQNKAIQDNKEALRKAMDDTSNRGRVAVCSVRRSSGAKWGLQNRCDGLSRCLTTTNSDLYAFSLGEGFANPALSLDRYLTVNERCLLQGFPPLTVLTALGLPEKHTVHALGNAMAVPVVGAVMTCILHGLGPHGFEPR